MHWGYVFLALTHRYGLTVVQYFRNMTAGKLACTANMARLCVVAMKYSTQVGALKCSRGCPQQGSGGTSQVHCWSAGLGFGRVGWYIQCGSVITWSIFSKILTINTSFCCLGAASLLLSPYIILYVSSCIVLAMPTILGRYHTTSMG